MTRPAMILAAVSVLCVGLALGFMGGVLFSRHVVQDLAHGHDGYGWHHGHGRPSPHAIADRLQRMLELTPEQASAIRDEIEHSRGDFDRVRDSLHARIERHLTAPQIERWHELEKERDGRDSRGSDPRSPGAEPGKEGGR